MDKQDILDMIEIDEDDLFLEHNYMDFSKVIHTPTGISVKFGTNGLLVFCNNKKQPIGKDDAIKILKARLLSKLINDMGKEKEEKEDENEEEKDFLETELKIKKIHKDIEIKILINKIESDISILKGIDLPSINGIEYHFNRLKELVI